MKLRHDPTPRLLVLRVFPVYHTESWRASIRLFANSKKRSNRPSPSGLQPPRLSPGVRPSQVRRLRKVPRTCSSGPCRTSPGSSRTRGSATPRRPSPSRSPQDSENEAIAELYDLVAGRSDFDVTDTDEYVEGCVVGLDTGLVRKLRQGKFARQAALDLHGMKADEARPELERFLNQATQARPPLRARHSWTRQKLPWAIPDPQGQDETVAYPRPAGENGVGLFPPPVPTMADRAPCISS